MSIEFNVLPTEYNAKTFAASRQPAKKNEFQQLSGENGASEAPLTEAIRLYRNYILTGRRELTSEEKEEITRKIEDYMDETNFIDKYKRNKASEPDYSALNDFIKGLYRQFGSCADYYDFVTDYVEGMLEKVADPNNPPLPPFKVKIPPEHAQEMENSQEKPMLAAFQSPSPHQFLMAGVSSDKS